MRATGTAESWCERRVRQRWLGPHPAAPACAAQPPTSRACPCREERRRRRRTGVRARVGLGHLPRVCQVALVAHERDDEVWVLHVLPQLPDPLLGALKRGGVRDVKHDDGRRRAAARSRSRSRGGSGGRARASGPESGLHWRGAGERRAAPQLAARRLLPCATLFLSTSSASPPICSLTGSTSAPGCGTAPVPRCPCNTAHAAAEAHMVRRRRRKAEGGLDRAPFCEPLSMEPPPSRTRSQT